MLTRSYFKPHFLSEYSIKIFNSVNDLNKEQWDSLSTSVLTQYRFLQILENLRDLNVNPFYVEIWNESKLAATCIFYHELEAEYFTMSQSVFGPLDPILKKVGLGIDPSLTNASPIGTTFKNIEVHPDLINDQSIYNQIVFSLESIAKANNIKSYGLINIYETDILLRKALKSNRFVSKYSSFQCYMDIIWDSMDAYWKGFKKRKRDALKRERSINRRRGVIFKRGGLDPGTVDKMIKIYNDNFYKYQQKRSKVNDDLIRNLVESMADNIEVINAYQSNELIASHLIIKWNKTLNMFKLGQIEEVSKTTKVIFSVAIYELVEYAINNGYEKIYMGTGAYRYKSRRGGSLRPMYLHIKSSTFVNQFLLKLVFPILSYHKLKKHKKESKLK